MRHSRYYNLRLPERIEGRNDPADIDDLTFDIESVDGVLKVQDTEDKRLERDKADVAALNNHKTASPADHPDGSITDDKLGQRTVLTTGGLLQPLLTAIGNAIRAIAGTAGWNDPPAITLAAAKVALEQKAGRDEVLQKTNTEPYTPTESYHPATKKYIDDQMGAAGSGDMMKAVYDTNNNGIVDRAAAADSVAWGAVSGKPASFAPSAHSHDERYFTEAEVNNLLAAKIPTSASCNKNWNWSGQGGQPTWVWGGADPTNMYVYNPANFSVNYASSANYANGAGNADTVDGFHIAGIGSSAPGSLANNALFFVYE